MSHKIAAVAQKKPFFFLFYLIQPSAHTLHHLRSRKLERSNVWQHNFTKHSHAIISFSPSHSLEIIYFIIGFWETNRAITGFSQVIYPSRCALLLRSNPADYLLCRSGPPWPGGALVYRQLCFMTGIRIAGSWLDLSCSGDSWPRRREVHQLPFSHGSYTSAMSEADCCLSLWYRLEDCAGGGGPSTAANQWGHFVLLEHLLFWSSPTIGPGLVFVQRKRQIWSSEIWFTFDLRSDGWWENICLLFHQK